MHDPVYNKIGLMKNFLPEWFKKTEKFIGGKLNIEPSSLTVKHCMPFLDAYLTGYCITTPIDLLVIKENDDIKIKWRQGMSASGEMYIGVRDGSTSPGSMTPGMPTPAGYEDKHFTWATKYVIKCPEGYSLLLTQPLNRMDLPTYTLSGIVDAEQTLQSGNIPFFIKKGFTGVIPAGTPIMQVIPIKREKWSLVENQELIEEARINDKYSQKHILGYYKNKLWYRKEYL